MSKKLERLKEFVTMYRVSIVVSLLFILMFLVFSLGSMYSCTGQNIYRDGFRCVTPRVVDVCEDLQGHLYRIDLIPESAANGRSS